MAESGLEVEYDEGLLDNADFLAQYSPDLRAGNNTSWDVMSPGGWVVERMARNGWLEELDHSKLPNWTANCADYAKGLWFDPENKYSVWWQGGITGWRTTRTSPVAKSRPSTTSSTRSSPAARAASANARHVRADAPVTWGPACECHGRRRASCPGEAVGAPDGHFRGFYGNEYYDSLAAGDLAICVAWSGDISQMNLYDNEDVRFVVPDPAGCAGTTTW